MKRLFFTILIIFLHVTVFAQNSVSLVVVGEGNTKDEATQSALRSAIEQSFGSFVSSNTTILNDDLVKDEIVSISSGNIQNYKELSFSRLEDGHCSITIEATVSLAKLTRFAQSKGSTCELAGATFGANLQMAQFYMDAEKKAIENLLDELRRMLPSMYDYSLSVHDPKPEQTMRGQTPTMYDLVCDVTIKNNAASEQFCSTLVNTLKGLSMNDKTATSFQNTTGIKPKTFYIDEDKSMSWGNTKIVLRDEKNVDSLEDFINNELVPSMVSFVVEDNLGEIHQPSLRRRFRESSYAQILEGKWPDMYRHYNSSNHVTGDPGRYSIRYLWKESKYTCVFTIKIPMDDISKYRSFAIRKEGR